MMLHDTNAIVYGAGGSLGGAVAKALAREGATVFVTGRTLASVERLAADITASGGKAEAAALDALDTRAVDRYLNQLTRRGLSLDVSFDAIGLEDLQGTALIDMQLEDFIRPVRIAMQTQFITATAAARIMKEQRSGVILSLTATPGGIGYPHVGGFGPACCAIESFSRNLASEVGPFAVRVVNIRSAGSPHSRVCQEALAAKDGKAFFEKIKGDTMLHDLPAVGEVANVAACLAPSLDARSTGVTVDDTCGTTAALNYKVAPIAVVQHDK